MRAAILTITLLIPGWAAGEDTWPGWRGPHGDGSSSDGVVPLRWTLEENLVWKTPLPGFGHSSPIVWKDAVFVVAALEDEEKRVLLRIDRASGRIEWMETVLASPLEGKHRKNSFASSTPATDGERVYVSFLDRDSMFVAAYDFEGKLLWAKRPGVFSSVHGYCSSPVLWKDKVIINGDHDGEAYLVALDKASGQTVWKTERPNRKRSYCTPLVRTIEGRHQLMLSGSKCVASFDPDTGKQQWVIDGPTEQFVASLVYNEDRLFMTCGFPEKHIMAIDPTGTGNVTETHVLWRSRKDPAYVPSPVVIGPYLLLVSDSGKASCWNAATGERHWVEKIGREHSASAVAVRDHACFLSETGVMTVVRADKKFQLVAVNELGEETFASPVVSRGRWLLRGAEHLYCIGKR